MFERVIPRRASVENGRDRKELKTEEKERKGQDGQRVKDNVAPTLTSWIRHGLEEPRLLSVSAFSRAFCIASAQHQND